MNVWSSGGMSLSTLDSAICNSIWTVEKCAFAKPLPYWVMMRIKICHLRKPFSIKENKSVARVGFSIYYNCSKTLLFLQVGSLHPRAQPCIQRRFLMAPFEQWTRTVNTFILRNVVKKWGAKAFACLCSRNINFHRKVWKTSVATGDGWPPPLFYFGKFPNKKIIVLIISRRMGWKFRFVCFVHIKPTTKRIEISSGIKFPQIIESAGGYFR